MTMVNKEEFEIINNLYNKVHNPLLTIKLLNTANEAVNKYINYLENVDVSTDIKKLIENLASCGDLVYSINRLEKQIKKELINDNE